MSVLFCLWRYWPQLHRPCGHRPTPLHCYQWAGGWGGGLHPGCHLQHRQHCPGFSEGYLHLSRSHRHRHGKVKSGELLEQLFHLFCRICWRERGGSCGDGQKCPHYYQPHCDWNHRLLPGNSLHHVRHNHGYDKRFQLHILTSGYCVGCGIFY